MKPCKKCNAMYEVNEENFYKRKTNSDGFHNTCITCWKQIDALRASSPVYKAKNRTQSLNYRNKNKDKVNAHNAVMDKVNSVNLTDRYIKKRLADQLEIVGAKEISQDLIELKRTHLIVQRTLKIIKHGNNSSRCA